MDEVKAGYRYAPDKWSIKTLVSHMSDAERVENDVPPRSPDQGYFAASEENAPATSCQFPAIAAAVRWTPPMKA